VPTKWPAPLAFDPSTNFKSLTLLAVYFDPTGPRRICWFRRPATGVRADVGRCYCGHRAYMNSAEAEIPQSGAEGMLVTRADGSALGHTCTQQRERHRPGASSACSKSMARSSPARRWTARFPLSSNGTRPFTSTPTPVCNNAVRVHQPRNAIPGIEIAYCGRTLRGIGLYPQSQWDRRVERCDRPQSLPKVRMPNRDGFIPFPRNPK
jgi:hypothetical protein